MKRALLAICILLVATTAHATKLKDVRVEDLAVSTTSKTYTVLTHDYFRDISIGLGHIVRYGIGGVIQAVTFPFKQLEKISDKEETIIVP